MLADDEPARVRLNLLERVCDVIENAVSHGFCFRATDCLKKAAPRSDSTSNRTLWEQRDKLAG
ncbi:hypothetical protein BCB70_10875 [Cutibacterium modestum]|nr:hypothetical protein BCB70_10875 [Cutibacterium modestum]